MDGTTYGALGQPGVGFFMATDCDPRDVRELQAQGLCGK